VASAGVVIYGPACNVQGRLNDGRTNRNGCSHISGLVVKASARLRALMKDALLLLLTLSAWRPLTTSESGEAGLTDRVISSGIPLALSRSVLGHGLCSARLYNGFDSVLLVMRQERPDNPSIRVRQCDGSPVLAASGNEGAQPPAALIRLGVDPAERGARRARGVYTDSDPRVY
jgi:hypothetical protein